MKIISFAFIIIITSINAFCQTISINGSVKDEHGQPIPLAFIRDIKHYYATYADSSGSFMLKADPTSILVAIAVNYAETKIKIDNKTIINIVMAKGGVIATDALGKLNNRDNSNTLGNSLGILTKQTLATQSGSSQISKAGFNQEATKGSPYLFLNWVHGFAVGADDSLLYDINNLYNYDKTTGELLFTKDLNSIMQVNAQTIKHICLFNGKLQPAVFESAPAISNKSFIEVLLGTPKYKIYKQTEAKLNRADFHTDGVIEFGHRYDEYEDVLHYYFVKLPGDKPKQISLKKKMLKDLLAGDADKFISAQADRNIDDDYLRDLSYSLNN